MQNDQQEQHKQQLIERYIAGKASENELMAFFGLVNRQELDELLLLSMDSDFESERLAAYSKYHQRKSKRWWIAAASVFLVFSVGAYLFIPKHPVQQIVQNQVQDIAPGSNKAILKLANGKQISITDAKNGLLAQQGNTMITKNADGKLTYANRGRSSDIILYDTLIVPRGGQHQVKFSDGSVMVVNADSKLRIPENFIGSDRTVELITGEADFKVVLNKNKPFRVKVGNIVTQDLGTEFNINAYPEEAEIKTTLLEGSIKVTKNNLSKIIKPGQQATVNESANGINVQDVDTDAVFAWTNGKFLFNDESLSSIMRQASRWYDVDVVYDDEGLKAKRFGGVTARFANVSQLLNTLELTNKVKFTIEGRKIIVHHK